MSARVLEGYTLDIACTKCGLRKRIKHFPVQGAPELFAILETPHQQIWEKGCLRCGTCRFKVLTIPPPPPLPEGPEGWVKRTP